MAKHGRKFGLSVGCILGIIGASLCAFAVYRENFWLLVFSTPFIGMFTGFAEFIKYSANEISSESSEKKRYISIIVTAGVIAAFIGPWAAKYSNDYLINIQPYLGPYLAVLGFCTLGLMLSLCLRLKNVTTEATENTVSVGLRVVLKNQHFVFGLAASAIAYLVMAAMMDAMPITMMAHDFHFEHTTQVLQWHLLAMFAPSYFTGKLIDRFGARCVVLVGIVLNAVGVGAALIGTDFHNFWIALFLIGLGWNLMYLAGVGVIATIADDLRPAAEAASNAILVICFAISAPIASIILFQFGWMYVSLYALMQLGVVLIISLKFKAHSTNQNMENTC